MRWFFYGTLMDADILEIVLNRKIDPSGFVEAYAKGYQRWCVRGEDYPVLRQAAGEIVSGVLAELEAPRDASRLAWYEGDGFRRVEIPVQTIDGETVTARAFIDLGAHTIENRIWDYRVWKAGLSREAMIGDARQHMRAYKT